jgi:hypothetical protein
MSEPITQVSNCLILQSGNGPGIQITTAKDAARTRVSIDSIAVFNLRQPPLRMRLQSTWQALRFIWWDTRKV